MKYSDFKPISPEVLLVLLFFFLNTFLLPPGLLYTTLLTPLFILLIIKKRKLKYLFWYAAISIPVILYHRSIEAEMLAYAKSYLLFSSCVIFVIIAALFLKNHHHKLGGYFKNITIFNFYFTLIALIAFFLPLVNNIFWYDIALSPGLPVIPRLKMLVYEPSFYALQLAPVFLFYFVSFLFEKKADYLPGLVLLAISLILSLSFGVLGGLVIAVILVFVFNFRKLLFRKKVVYTFFYFLLISAAGLFLTLKFYPHNPLFERWNHILLGWDTSANGRTWEAFMLAWKILQKTDYLLGAGLGQIKVAGHDIIVNYYLYEGEWVDIVRIPNAMAETLVSFGFIGIIVRLFTQIGLFFYTRVHDNYYRLMLFAFIFIYQFTGSYLTNIYEYLIWILAFLPVFPQFDRRRI